MHTQVRPICVWYSGMQVIETLCMGARPAVASHPSGWRDYTLITWHYIIMYRGGSSFPPLIIFNNKELLNTIQQQRTLIFWTAQFVCSCSSDMHGSGPGTGDHVHGVICCCAARGYSGNVTQLVRSPKIGRFGFCGHEDSPWSSCPQYEHLWMARALPVKVSLYERECLSLELSVVLHPMLSFVIVVGAYDCSLVCK